MRRKEKEITDKNEVEQILKDAKVCRLGMVDEKSPYIIPVNFGYKDNILYFHSAPAGRKIDVLRKNPDICFEIDIHGDLVKSEKACNWSINYRSIIGEGRVEFINNPDKKAEALNIIMDHYSGKTDWELNSKMMEKTLVFKVEITKFSAKGTS